MFCDFVFGILGTLLMSLFIFLKKGIFKDFNKSLNIEQKNVLNSLIKERVWVCIFAFIFAIILIYGLSFLINYDKTNKPNKICLVICILVFITLLIYTVFPKSDYFILHLSKDQMRNWLNLCEYLKLLLIIGFITGVFIYFLFSKIVNKIFLSN